MKRVKHRKRTLFAIFVTTISRYLAILFLNLSFNLIHYLLFNKIQIGPNSKKFLLQLEKIHNLRQIFNPLVKKKEPLTNQKWQAHQKLLIQLAHKPKEAPTKALAEPHYGMTPIKLNIFWALRQICHNIAKT